MESTQSEANRLNNISIWADQAQNGDLKEAINLLIWRWGHPDLKLMDAEKIACEIFDMIIETPPGVKEE